MKETCLAAILSMLVASCASYTENGLFGGFRDTPLAADTYRIQANGNAFTSRSKTTAIAMVRAADLALQHGYDRFIVLDYDEWAKTSYYTSPTTATTNSVTNTNLYARGYGYNVGNYRYTNIYGNADSRTTATTTINHGQTYAIEKPRTGIVVKFVSHGSKEAARALLASDVIARYGKIAGYKPAEGMQISQTAQMSPPAPAQSPGLAETVQTAAHVQKAAAAINTLAAQPPVENRERTLEEIYESLSADEKFIADAMSPAERVNYLYLKQ